jgi:hypothetical protein
MTIATFRLGARRPIGGRIMALLSKLGEGLIASTLCRRNSIAHGAVLGLADPALAKKTLDCLWT